MKIKTDYIFPEQYRLMAEEYISYKHSLALFLVMMTRRNVTNFSDISILIHLLTM